MTIPPRQIRGFLGKTIMHTKFDIAIASVIGSEHIRTGKNNQDAMFVVQGNNFLCGCVSDGCGSCPRSELGAVITTRLVTKHVPLCIAGATINEVQSRLSMAKDMILTDMRDISLTLSESQFNPTSGMDVGAFDMMPGLASFDGTMISTMLATAFGFYACDDFVAVFHIGDGYYAFNGQLVQVDAEDKANNAPAYTVYGLMPEVASTMAPGALDFSVKIVPMDQFERLMIATDGVRFFSKFSELQIPGKTRKVGGIEQLWDDKVFTNPYTLQRTLGLLNRDVNMPDWPSETMLTRYSILKDDTTVISIRRKNEDD